MFSQVFVAIPCFMVLVILTLPDVNAFVIKVSEVLPSFVSAAKFHKISSVTLNYDWDPFNSTD